MVPPHDPPPQVQRESAGRFNQIEQNLKSMTEIFYKIWQCCFTTHRIHGTNSISEQFIATSAEVTR